MAWVNEEGVGFRGQVAVDVAPETTRTPFGRVRAFMTEAGTVVVENAPGEPVLASDGYGFLMGLEIGPGQDDGCHVGPYQDVLKPDRPRHEACSAARERVESALMGVAARFLAANEAAVLARATEHLRARLAADGAGADADRNRHPDEAEDAGPPPPPAPFAKIFDTPYGPVEGEVTGEGHLRLVGAGIQGSIVVDGVARSLGGSCDPLRGHTDPVLTLRDVFVARRGPPSYAWRSEAPALADLWDAVRADGETVAACLAASEHHQRERERANRAAAYAQTTANLRRLTARLDAIDPEAAAFPSP